MAYLDDHPNPNTPQQRRPRRAPLSGTVGIHDTEGFADMVAPDYGAENTAGFISSRSGYGSYHVLVDSDSAIRMVEDDAEAWHIAESDNFGYGMNSHSWGISGACRTTEWNPDGPWTYATIDSMGREIADFWMRNGWDPIVNARWLTRTEAKNRQPGLVHHGVVQPSDRSDAWVNSQYRDQLDAMLIDAIVRHSPGGRPTTPTEEIPMSAEANILTAVDDLKKSQAQWETDTRRHARAPRAVVVPGKPEQWVVLFQPTPRRYHIKDQAERSLFVEAGIIADLPPITLTSQAAATLMSYPEAS